MTQDTTWTRFESHLQNKGLTRRRINKLHTMYNITKRILKQKIENSTRKDIEQFVDQLHRNTTLSEKNKPFSGSTKADLKRFIKQFFKWHKGKNEFFPPEVRWITVRISKDEQPKEKPTLTVEELKKFAYGFNKIEYRIATFILYDSGFRVGELLSAKKRDLTWEPYDEDQHCFWIKCNDSKTEVRKVPIPLFTEELQAFVNSAAYQHVSDDAPLFNIRYSNLIQRYKDCSKKVLGKIITPHALRHSSATYYAREYDGNLPMLAERYGWTFSSEQLKTYIRRSGAYQKAGAKKVFTNEVSVLKKKMLLLEEKHEAELAVLKQVMRQMSDELDLKIANNKW